jgi:Pentapeptide repeats (9 copies)
MYVVSGGSAYLVGRTRVHAIGPDQSRQDSIFAALRLDGSHFASKTFVNCTFANVSFKDCVLTEIKFSNCAFLDCYFRNARMTNCEFSACKFIHSGLEKVDIRSCDFKYYNTFTDCFVKYDTISESLPTEGNLRSRLCENLAGEARKVGAPGDEGKYRQQAASAMEKHLWFAVKGSSQFFKEKYQGADRLACLYNFLVSRLRGYLWGYRRSWLVVLRNWAILTMVFFPPIFLLMRSGLQRGGKPADRGDAWIASIGNMLPGSGISDVRFISNACIYVAFAEVLTGLLFAGLAAALLFRAVYDRWH